MDLRIFSQLDFLSAVKALFKDLKVPMNYVADEPTSAREILKDTYKDNDSFQLMDDIYFVGMVDDAAFDGNKSLDSEKIKSDYDGILIFGVTLKNRPNGLLPTRSQLAEISRAFNREFYYTPVVVVFKYENYLAFANTERLKYKQEWREGEKAGKVSMLRDIHIEKPHSGHERILQELQIPTTGGKKVDTFAKLYAYWQEVFSVSLLNKKFYQELSNWYLWARGEVVFPSPPLRIDYDSDGEFDESLDEHNGKNLIRLLTRILFVWFVKEKGLIPHQIFDETFISEELLSEFEPQKPNGFFAQGKHTSRYYRAILQNLFFATLNCEKDKREFRKDGQHQNTTHLMRYKGYFKNPDFFLELMEKHVPFMNGGLFDCLDKPHKEKKGKQGGDIIIYHDGFSDREDNPLSIPDYLFFDKDEQVDLSKEYGQVKYKNVKTKGLLKILESYKFTITENTPIEEDVALDPELLGRVFENLLASYNPETKTTARKQTGSFYTPREIVNYMVDESLIAYLKNSIERELWSCSDEDLDRRLHDLVAFDNQAEFEANDELKGALIRAIDNCKILDPACGSGAFPMGVLQKMVHILSKVDPKNNEWEQRQLKKIDEAISRLDEIDDSEIRDKSIKELNEQKKDIEQAFEKNDLDYGRKLYLIENCIYGVDIQSIAVQISKLRFFISLIVDQYDDSKKDNFGIRPLPNLETKFVAANTLIGVNKGQSLFDNQEVKELEKQIKLLNKKLFSIKTPSRKRELREEIKAVRIKMADILEDEGLDNQSARQLAGWDPFDQNSSSPFFDTEWMFDISEGFDVVIGNPPYVRPRTEETEILSYFKRNFETAHNQLDLFHLFIEFAVKNITNNGVNSYIISNAFLANENTEALRNYILDNTSIISIVDLKEQVFEGASVDTIVYLLKKSTSKSNISSAYILVENNIFSVKHFFNQNDFRKNVRKNFTISLPSDFQFAFNAIRNISTSVDSYFHVTTGIKEYQIGKGIPPQVQSDKDNRVFNSNSKINDSYLPELRGKNLNPFNIVWNGEHVKYGPWLAEPRRFDFFNGNKILIRKIPSKYRLVLSVHSEDMIVDQSIYVGKKKVNCEVNEFYAVGTLSSKLLHWYFKTFNNETDDLFPQIKTKQFKELPIKYDRAFINSITTISLILHFEVISTILDVLDALVFNLYFPDHMKERGIDVLELVERDINEVMQGREFEKLRDAEKEQMIETLHTKWSHPDNEVRNRIKLFAVRSPEILKPILES